MNTIPTPPANPPELPEVAPEAAPEVSTREDDDAPSAMARRAGPIVALVSLLLTGGLVAWMSIVPTDIAGPLSASSLEVPGLLATPVNPAGCLQLVDGRGEATSLCVEGTEEYDGVYFDAQGRLLVGTERLMVVDQQTGEVLERLSYDEVNGPMSQPPPPGHEPGYANVQGSQVRDSETDEVLLDAGGPWGYRLQQAVISPDGAWVVAVDPQQRVIVAPSDGSAPPHVWADVDTDGYMDIQRAILWSTDVTG